MARISEISEVVAVSEIVEVSEIREVVECEIEAEPEITENAEESEIREAVKCEIVEIEADPEITENAEESEIREVVKCEIVEIEAEPEITENAEESEIREGVKCEIVEIEAEPEITKIVQIEMMPVRTSIAHDVIEDIRSPPKYMSRIFKASVIVLLLTILISVYIVIGCVHIKDNQPILGLIDIHDVHLELDISNHTLLFSENATLDIQFSKPTRMVGYPDLRAHLDLGYSLFDGPKSGRSFTFSAKNDYVLPILNDSVSLRFNTLEIELDDKQLSALTRRFEDFENYWTEIHGEIGVAVKMKTLWFLRLHKRILFSCKVYFSGRPPMFIMARKKCIVH